MKRNEIVSRLIKEGFSEKTLVNFSDKQLANLSERMFNEVLKVSPDKLGDENVKAAVQDPDSEVEVEENAFIGNKKACKVCKMSPCKCGKEKKPKETKEGNAFGKKIADAKKEGKPSIEIGGKKVEVKETAGEPFEKKVKGVGKKLEATEEDKKWIQKAIKHPGKLHKDLGVPKDEKIPAAKLDAAAKKGGKIGKEARLAKTLKGLHESDSGLNAKRNLHFELKEAGVSEKDLESKDINELAEKHSNNPYVKSAHDYYKRINNKSMSMTGKDTEMKEWVMTLAENKLYHSFTSKGEIMNLIKTKLNESKK